MTAIISMDGVCLSFGNKQVLHNLTFDVRRGETFGFLGPSGAGKTTTIKLLTRQLVKDSGHIMLFGRPIERTSESDYERIGILSDTSALYERLSIADNLRFYARLRGVSERNIQPLLTRMRLDKDAKTLVKNCSRGMRQRAALLAVMIHSPELLFLDEPTSGLDPVTRAEVHRMLGELKASGTTVFLTTHDMAEADDVCDRIGILAEGHLVAFGKPEQLKLQFARNHIIIRTRTHGTIETTKDATAAEQIGGLLQSGEILSIHSDEPNLEEVFLELTGKEF